MRHEAQGCLLPGSRVGAWLLAVLTLAAVCAWAPQAQAAPGDITTAAGNGTFGSSGDGGPATAASTGSVEGVFYSPVGLYLMEDAGPRARYVNLAGTISTVAGGGASDPGDGGLATDALLADPEQVIRDRNGNVYFSAGNRVRRVSSLGIITTVAGTGTAGFSGDGGAATAAQLARPHGLALDLAGNLYIGDCDNNRVRRVSTLGVITTVAGTGTLGYSGDGGPATAAEMGCPADVSVDPWGRLLITDNDSHVVRAVDLGTGTISTLAGTGVAGYSGDGGAATAAALNGPQGLETDGTGSVYIAESFNHVIRKVDAGGTITTLAGTAGTASYSGDGGPASLATLNGPRDVAFDSETGDLYIADRYNNRARRIEALGVPDPPPSVTIDSSPASPGTDSTPTWTFSTASTQQVDFECRLTRGATVISDWSVCSSPTTYDLSGEVAGTDTFEVRAITVSGVGSPASSSYAHERADRFEFDLVGEQTTGRAFDVTIRAKTPSGMTDTSFTGTAALSVNSGSISPGTSGAFVAGVRTQSITITGPYTAAQTITATAGSVTGSSPTFTLHDRKYYFKQTTANTGSGCAAAWAKRDMEEGYAGQDPEETHTRYTGGAEMINFCSPTFTSAETLNAGTAVVYAYVNNTHGSTCNISATLLKNGSVSLGSSTRTIPPQIPVTLFTWSINTSATTMAVGDRLNLRFQMQAVKACNQSDIHYGGTVYRSHLELLAGVVPVPTITSDPGPAGSDETPIWAFTGEAGATFECRLEDGAGQPVPGYDWASCSSPATYDLSALLDGPYSFAVRQTTAGGTSFPARSDYVLDRVDPVAPTIASSPPSPDNTTSVSWSFTGEDGATFECRLLKGAAIVSDWGACADSQAYTLTDGDGTYTFEVRQTDEAGNLGPSNTRTYELDTSAPSQPAILSAPSSPGSDTTPTWTFQGEPSALLECRLTRGATVISDWTGCLSPHTYDLGRETDGTYTFSIRQTDLAGNVSAPNTSTYVLDTAAASAPTIDSGPPLIGNDPTPSWAFSGELGASFTCRLQDDQGQPVAGYDWASCSSPETFDLSAAPDGDYTFLVRQTDAAGNTSSPATADYMLDTAAPGAPTIDSSPPAQGSATNPSWSFSGAAGATFECRLSRGATVISDWAACSSPNAVDLGGEADGTYTFAVRAVDAAGNRGGATTDDYTLDRIGPPQPTFTGTPGAVSNDDTPTWSFTGEAGASFECRLERGATVVSDWQSCASPANFDLTSAPDSSYRLLVRAVDGAGNVGPQAGSSYELDRNAPATPVIDSGPGPIGNGRAPAWSFTGDPLAVHECRLTRNGLPVFDWAACAGSAAYDLTGQPDGVYAFAVRGRDEAGNTGQAATSSYELDTAGSTVTIESGPQPLGNSSNPAWSFGGEAGAVFECRLLQAGAVASGWAACTSPYGYDLSSSPDGAYTFQLRSRDSAGNTGEPASYEFAVDRVAPAAPVFTLSPSELGNSTLPRWEFTAEPGAALECALTNGGTPTFWEPCAGGRTHDLSTAGDGTYTLLVRATDAARNVGPTSGSSYRFDATAPGAPDITDGPGARGEARRVSWSFSGEPGALFECRLTRQSRILDGWQDCDSPTPFDLSESSPGDHTFSVRATDVAGNRGPAARSDYELLSAEDERKLRHEPRGFGNGGAAPDGGDGFASPQPPPSQPGAAPSAGGSPEPSDAAGPRPERRDGRSVTIEPRDREEPGPTPSEDRPEDDSKNLGERMFDALGAAAHWAGSNPDKTAFPLFLALLVLGYMAVQNRLDRRDPKLALAPVHADNTLEFGPPPTSRQGVGPVPPPLPNQ